AFSSCANGVGDATVTIGVETVGARGKSPPRWGEGAVLCTAGEGLREDARPILRRVINARRLARGRPELGPVHRPADRPALAHRPAGPRLEVARRHPGLPLLHGAGPLGGDEPRPALRRRQPAGAGPRD